PEFVLLAMPHRTYYARIFYMSTVANPDTHMFEAKAEVLDWVPEKTAPVVRALLAQSPPRQQAARLALGLGGWFAGRGPWGGLAGQLVLQQMAGGSLDPELRPGFTARIRFPMQSNPRACVVPEEALRASERGFIAFVPVQQPRDDGKTEWVVRARTVEVGFRTPGWVEIREGLAPGELIVRRGAEALE